jgi:hypothetical protein
MEAAHARGGAQEGFERRNAGPLPIPLPRLLERPRGGVRPRGDVHCVERLRLAQMGGSLATTWLRYLFLRLSAEELRVVPWRVYLGPALVVTWLAGMGRLLGSPVRQRPSDAGHRFDRLSGGSARERTRNGRRLS